MLSRPVRQAPAGPRGALHRACRKEPVRFGSVPDFSTINRFGSVRFGNLIFPVPSGSACVFRTLPGSVRFDSVRFRIRFRPVPAGSEIKRFGSVRFGHFGSVSYSFLIGVSRLPGTHAARCSTSASLAAHVYRTSAGYIFDSVLGFSTREAHNNTYAHTLGTLYTL